MKNKSIVAIGAHPDDIEIGCGGTIKKYINDGCKVYFIIATLGENCEHNLKKKIEIGKIRKNESQRSAKYLGVNKVYFLNLADTKIRHEGNTVNALEKIIKAVKPDYIFTHTVNDNHQDHRNLALSTISACRRYKTNILHYESPSTAQIFTPLVFSDVSKTIKDKLEALKLFSSQNDKIYVDSEAIKGLANYRGYISGSKFAESFEISKFQI